MKHLECLREQKIYDHGKKGRWDDFIYMDGLGMDGAGGCRRWKDDLHVESSE